MSIENEVQPQVMSPEEIEYRKALRDAIADVTIIFLREHQAEIVQRAQERLAFAAKLEAK